MQNISLKKFIPGTLWLLLILVLICLPGKDVPHVGWLERLSFDKVVHLIIFCLLGVLFCWPFYYSTLSRVQRLKYFIGIAISVSVFGFITELIQKLFIPGRSFDLLDWAADSLGALLALWFCSIRFSRSQQN